MPVENLQVVSSAGACEGERVLHVNGALSLYTVPHFQAALRKETTPVLIVDFEGVSYIDSAGLGALVAAYVSAQKAKRRLVFARMNSQAEALLKITHLARFFQIFPTIQDAEAALSRA